MLIISINLKVYKATCRNQSLFRKRAMNPSKLKLFFILMSRSPMLNIIIDDNDFYDLVQLLT